MTVKCPKCGREGWLDVGGKYQCVKCGHWFKVEKDLLGSEFAALHPAFERAIRLPGRTVLIASLEDGPVQVWLFRHDMEEVYTGEKFDKMVKDYLHEIPKEELKELLYDTHGDFNWGDVAVNVPDEHWKKYGLTIELPPEVATVWHDSNLASEIKYAAADGKYASAGGAGKKLSSEKGRTRSEVDDMGTGYEAPRAKPGASGSGRYYHVEVVRFKKEGTCRTHDIGREGHTKRIACKDAKGNWYTQKLLLDKGDFDVRDGRLVPVSAKARSWWPGTVEKYGRPRHVEGDRWRFEGSAAYAAAIMRPRGVKRFGTLERAEEFAEDMRAQGLDVVKPMRDPRRGAGFLVSWRPVGKAYAVEDCICGMEGCACGGALRCRCGGGMNPLEFMIRLKTPV